MKKFVTKCFVAFTGFMPLFAAEPSVWVLKETILSPQADAHVSYKELDGTLEIDRIASDHDCTLTCRFVKEGKTVWERQFQFTWTLPPKEITEGKPFDMVLEGHLKSTTGAETKKTQASIQVAAFLNGGNFLDFIDGKQLNIMEEFWLCWVGDRSDSAFTGRQENSKKTWTLTAERQKDFTPTKDEAMIYLDVGLSTEDGGRPGWTPALFKYVLK
jgi:hypothetical protein